MLSNASARAVGSSLWHRKAKYALRKVLIKTPQNSTEIRQVCNDMVEKRLGNQSMGAVVVNTALKLWEDEALVNALQRNPTFQCAKDRIQTLSNHILPNCSPNYSAIAGSIAAAKSMSESNSQLNAQPPINPGPSLFSTGSSFQHTDGVFQCSVCGNHLLCQHDHGSLRHQSNTIDHDVEVLSDSEDCKSYTPGSIGKTPENPFDSVWDSVKAKTFYSNSSNSTTSNSFNDDRGHPSSDDEFSSWFGPLVLASMAVLGLAMGVFTGDIVVPRLSNLTSRAVTAVSMVMQASNSLCKFLRQ